MTPESLDSPGCRADDMWDDDQSTQSRIFQLTEEQDGELLDRASEELSRQKSRFDNGVYPFESLYIALKNQFYLDSRKLAFATTWQSQSANRGYACVALAMAYWGQTEPARGGDRTSIASLKAANDVLSGCPERTKAGGLWQLVNLHLSYQVPGRRPESMALYQTIVKRWPDGELAHQVVMHFALPEWHGSYAEMDDIANTAAASSHKTLGDGMYAWLYAHVMARLAGAPVTQSKADWNRIKRGIADLEARKLVTEDNGSRFALLACQFRDATEAQRLLAAYVTRSDAPGDRLLQDCRRYASE